MINLDKNSIKKYIKELYDSQAIIHNGKLNPKKVKSKISIFYYYIHLFTEKKNRSKMSFLGTVNKLSRKRVEIFYLEEIQRNNLDIIINNINQFIFTKDIMIPDKIYKNDYEDIIIHLTNELNECKSILKNINIDIKLKKI